MIAVEKYMEACTLCPRTCGVNRMNAETGVCGQTDEVKIARAALHMWEEPCISGVRGSGTVFFTGCSLHCVFCQNHSIATENYGEPVSVERLADIFLNLQEQGANNINLVTAEQFVPQIIAALDIARANGLSLPIVYNSSGYENVETIKLLDGYVDVYLPDLKYVDSELSLRYSHAKDYFEKASAAIAEMVRQTGEPIFAVEEVDGTVESARAAMQFPAQQSEDTIRSGNCTTQNWQVDAAEYQRRSESGESLIMTRGVIVRHLLLPGCVEDSKRVISYLLNTYGEQIFISIMNQYTPLPHVRDYQELTRRVTGEEYEAVIDYAIEHGIENGFIQEGDVAEESFIPQFDGEGV